MLTKLLFHDVQKQCDLKKKKIPLSLSFFQKREEQHRGPRPKLQRLRRRRWACRTCGHTSRHACGASAPWSSTATCTALSPSSTADSSPPPSSLWKRPTGVCGPAWRATLRRTAREISALPATGRREMPSLCRPWVYLPSRRVFSSCGGGWLLCGFQCGIPWTLVCTPAT